jgi:hypothetical protein
MEKMNVFSRNFIPSNDNEYFTTVHPKSAGQAQHNLLKQEAQTVELAEYGTV